ncbi:MAG TPA: Na(+)/H(+) antiporter subunit D [Bauldia sp.]|nr:Na(+)/H(+) antiporter subunit D [Bauldia sp.]
MTASLGGLGYLLMPGVVMMAAGFVLFFLRGPGRNALIFLAPLAVLSLVWLLPEGRSEPIRWLGYELVPFHSDALGRLFGTVFAFTAFAAGIYALRQERRAEIPVAFIYAGAALGVVFAADLITLFVFWEMMAVGSALIVWMGGSGARGAGLRYIVIHLLGGVLLMAGIAGQVAETGTIAFQAMHADSPAKWLILSGFLINAGAWPMSAWLPDSYPEASWSGMVFLSAFTTKTAVLVLLRGFPGEDILIVVGLIMVFYGIVYAILENDMRRILAYSIVNQVGFMVAAIGIGSELALNGAAAHAFVHIIYKALLLMSAGSVLLMTGRRKCSELGGLFRTMPLTTICGLVGALSISAFPLTSGFVAKSMISDGAWDDGLAVVWFLLTTASAGVFLHAGIKFPWFVFFQKDSGLRPPDPPWNMRAAMLLMSFVSIGIGIFPAPFYRLLPYPVDFVPYTGAHVVSQLQLLLFSGLAFFLLLGWLKRTDTITLDIDWLWRRLGPMIYGMLDSGSDRAWQALVRRSQRSGERLMRTIYRHHGPQGVLARAWPTGSIALWAVFLLGAYLIFYYF